MTLPCKYHLRFRISNRNIVRRFPIWYNRADGMRRITLPVPHLSDEEVSF